MDVNTTTFRDLRTLLEERHVAPDYVALLHQPTVALPKIVLHQITHDVISEVLGCLRRNLEPVGSSVMAPSRYVVYLHAAEYARIKTTIPLLREKTIRALADELDRLNHRSAFRRYVERVLGRQRPSIISAERKWFVEFLPAADGELEERALLIEAQLRVSPVVEPDFDRHVSRVSTRRVITRDRIVPDAPPRVQS
jgi:hypothetical protein